MTAPQGGGADAATPETDMDPTSLKGAGVRVLGCVAAMARAGASSLGGVEAMARAGGHRLVCVRSMARAGDHAMVFGAQVARADVQDAPPASEEWLSIDVWREATHRSI